MRTIEKDTQVKSFLRTGKTQEKAKVAGVPGLYLVKKTESIGIWEFARMRSGQRFHFRRCYPKCTLAQARSVFSDYNLRIDRGDPIETISPKYIRGFLKNPKKARCEPVFFSLEGY